VYPKGISRAFSRSRSVNWVDSHLRPSSRPTLYRWARRGRLPAWLIACQQSRTCCLPRGTARELEWPLRGPSLRASRGSAPATACREPACFALMAPASAPLWVRTSALSRVWSVREKTGRPHPTPNRLISLNRPCCCSAGGPVVTVVVLPDCCRPGLANRAEKAEISSSRLQDAGQKVSRRRVQGRPP